MQVRNLLIAAGAVLAGVTAIAAAPTAADAQVYRPAYRAEVHRERVHAIRRIEARRYWQHRRVAAYRHHHRPGFYRY